MANSNTFPDRTEGDRKEECEQRNERRAHVEIDMRILVQDVDEHETHHPEQEPGGGVEHHVPPPEPLIIIVHFAQEERREDEQHGDDLDFGRDLDRHPEQDRRDRHGHDPGHERRLGPVLPGEQDDELDRHDQLENGQNDHVSAVDGRVRRGRVSGWIHGSPAGGSAQRAW
jgi:hypothetical protein